MKTCQRCPNPVWGTRLCAPCVGLSLLKGARFVEFTRPAEPDPTLLDPEFNDVVLPVEELVTK